MDNQLPPIIIGVLLITPAIANISTSDSAPGLSPLAVYLLIALGFASISWGMYLNAASLKYPESPFNKHISPWLIAVIVVACLGFSAWTAFNGPIAELAYVFVAAIAVVLGATIRAATRNRRAPSKRGLP